MIDERKKDRVIYYDLLRMAATFAVVMLHIAAGGFYKHGVTSFQWNIQNLYDGISRWGVGIFVMISGALFLKADIPIIKIYKKYIFRIALAFITWSFAYAFVYEMIGGDHSIKKFLEAFIEGHGHLWFLYMIAGLYMIIPLLRKIIADNRLTKYYLILGFIFAFAVPEAISIIKEISPKYGNIAQTVVNRTNIHFVLGYSVYFALGYYLSNQSISKKQETIIYLLGIIGFVTTVLGNAVLARYKHTQIVVFFGDNTVNVLFEAMGVFVFFKNHFIKASLSEKKVKILSALSKYSFGAYLIHVFVIDEVSKFLHLNAVAFNPLFSIPLTAVIVYILSFAGSAVLNHIPVIKKYIV